MTDVLDPGLRLFMTYLSDATDRALSAGVDRGKMAGCLIGCATHLMGLTADDGEKLAEQAFAALERVAKP